MADPLRNFTKIMFEFTKSQYCNIRDYYESQKEQLHDLQYHDQ